MTDAEIGARLRVAREQAGYSGADLAKALGVSQPTISRLESGARRITAGELMRLAEFLRRPPQAFLQSAPAAVLFRRDQFRGLEPATQEATAWLEEFAIRLSVVADYTAALKLPRIATPDFGAAPQTFDEAELEAREVRRFLDLGGAPAPDMFAVVERLGCACVAREYEPVFEGMYVPRPANIALINGRQPGIRQRFTLAHELAHHLFHADGVIVDEDHFGPRTGSLDRMANVFAAHFLMPREGIELELHRRFGVTRPQEPEHAYWLAYAFGVSVDALCYHLTNLQLLSGKAASSWRGVTRAALLAGLGVEEDTQYQQVRRRWPPEFLRRLRFAHEEGLLTEDQVRSHLDGEIPEGLLEREAVPA